MGAHEHAALPETSQRTGCIMRVLEGDGAEERGAVCEAVPVVVPHGTTRLGGACGIAWLGDLAGVELVHVFLGWTDGMRIAELDGVLARGREVGWGTEVEHFHAGDVDELGSDGSEGYCERDVDVIEGEGGWVVEAVARVGTVEGGDGVGSLGWMPRKREGEVDIRRERGREL